METQSGDISAYIPTNVISITDGQIFLNTDLFNAGQRPAIDSGLSVSRVGGAAQFKATKQVAKSLKIDLASFTEMKSFSQFGSDLDKATLDVIKHGETLLAMLRQEQYKPRQLDQQVFELYLSKSKYLDGLDVNQVRETIDDCYAFVSANHKEIFASINEKKEILPEMEALLKSSVDDYFDSKKEPEQE